MVLMVLMVCLHWPRPVKKMVVWNCVAMVRAHATSSVSVNAAYNSAMMIAVLFSLKTMESLQNGFATYFQADSTVFNENKIASVVSQSCRSADADAWCKRSLIVDLGPKQRQMATVPNFDTHKMEVTHWHCDCLGLGPSVYFLHIIGLGLCVGFAIGLGQCK